MLKKLLGAVGGIVLSIILWEVRDWASPTPEAKAGFPAKLWEGGRAVTLVCDGDHPGRLHASFERAQDSEEHRLVEHWVDVPAGVHRVTLEVPSGTSATVECQVEAPRVGARTKVAVEVEGTERAVDEQTLAQPLEPGHAFFAQVEVEDLLAQ